MRFFPHYRVMLLPPMAVSIRLVRESYKMFLPDVTSRCSFLMLLVYLGDDLTAIVFKFFKAAEQLSTESISDDDDLDVMSLFVGILSVMEKQGHTARMGSWKPDVFIDEDLAGSIKLVSSFLMFLLDVPS